MFSGAYFYSSDSVLPGASSAPTTYLLFFPLLPLDSDTE